MSDERDLTTQHAVVACEEACRRLAAECLRASGIADRGSPDWRSTVLDVMYVAAATARALAARERFDWGATVMLVGACEQAARQAAGAWRHLAPLPLRDCITAGVECGRACASLTEVLAPKPVRRTEEIEIVDIDPIAPSRASPEQAA